MNCKECEKRIFLYREATQEEREAIELHVKSCPSCSRLFEEMMTTDAMLTQARQAVHLPKDPVTLTNRVMSAIPTKEQHANLLDYALRLDFSSVKYGMAAASVMMLILFVTEIREPDRTVGAQSSLQQNTAGIVLRSSELREDLMSRREKKSLFMDCTRKLNGIDLDCIKEKIEKLSF